MGTHHSLRVNLVFTQFPVSVGFFCFVLRAWPRLPEDLRLANQTASQYQIELPGATPRCKLNTSPVTFDNDLIYPAVTGNLPFLHSAISMSNKRFLQKFVLPFSIKIFSSVRIGKAHGERCGKRSRSSHRRGRKVLGFRCLRSMTPRSRIWFLRLPNKSRCGEFWHRDSLTIAPESFGPSHRSAIDGRKDEERMVGEHPSQLAIGNFLRRAITFALARACGNTLCTWCIAGISHLLGSLQVCG